MADNPQNTQPCPFDEDDLESIITDTLDMDWQPRWAARAIIRVWDESREEALSEVAAIDADEIAGDFYAFAARRAEILHCASPWGFSSDGAIIQRLLSERAKAGAV